MYNSPLNLLSQIQSWIDDRYQSNFASFLNHVDKTINTSCIRAGNLALSYLRYLSTCIRMLYFAVIADPDGRINHTNDE